MTLTNIEIVNSVKAAAKEYPIKRVILVGSYADGSFDENSDVDLIVEFETEHISLFTLSGFKLRMEELLRKEVDVIHGPLDSDAMIDIDQALLIFES